MASAVAPPPPHSSASRKGSRPAAWSASPPASSRGYSTNSPPPPEPEPEPATEEITPPMSDELRYKDKSSLETCYDTIAFLKDHPVVIWVHPKNAPDDVFDRLLLEGWFKIAARGLLETIGDHHLRGLEFGDFNIDNVKVFFNPLSSEFQPRFKITCETKVATYEGKRKNYTQAGQVFKEMIAASTDIPNPWPVLIEDAQHFLQNLEYPNLAEVYLLRNHPALLQLELHSQFYMACYEVLMNSPLTTIANVYKSLPYGIGDPMGHWQTLLKHHPYLTWKLLGQSSQFSEKNTEQCRFRRHYCCHKSQPLTPQSAPFKDYSPQDADRLLYQYLPMALPGLMKTMWDNQLLSESQQEEQEVHQKQQQLPQKVEPEMVELHKLFKSP